MRQVCRSCPSTQEVQDGDLHSAPSSCRINVSRRHTSRSFLEVGLRTPIIRGDPRRRPQKPVCHIYPRPKPSLTRRHCQYNIHYSRKKASGMTTSNLQRILGRIRTIYTAKVRECNAPECFILSIKNKSWLSQFSLLDQFSRSIPICELSLISRFALRGPQAKHTSHGHCISFSSLPSGYGN